MASNLTSTNTKIVGNSYTNENIETLQQQVNKANESLKQFNTTAATDEELRKRAESEYNPSYNAQIQEQESAKQTAASTRDEALSALDRQYARDAESLGRQYDTQRVTANNTMLARGFNNSSLAAAFLNQVETERNRALNNLQAERTASETSAQNTYNNAVAAANAAIGRLNTDRETNIDARYQALKEAEQARVLQAQQAQNQVTQYLTDLMLQIEQLRQQGYDQYLNQQQLAYEMGGSGGGSSGGGSSGGGSSSAGSAKSAATTGTSSSLADRYNNRMSSAVSNVAGGIQNAITSFGNLLSKAVSGATKQQTGGGSGSLNAATNTAKKFAQSAKK